MVKIPVYNTGQGDTVSQIFCLTAKTLRLETITPGGDHHISGIGAVSRYAAVPAHLFQRDPFAVIGHDHGKRGGAALQRLQLHDHRDAGAFLFKRIRKLNVRHDSLLN